jgi:NADH:ubiquinone oxidoreductase subunit 5 (subunit L)/multisubunit Na+/H+ antiporter MnhA subunit
MPEFDPKTLLVLVPALPLLGALLTVALGRLLGPRAHWPAVLSIAAAAVVAVTLLFGLGREAGIGSGHADGAAHPVEMVTTLWQWVSIPDAYTPPPGSPALDVGDDLAATAAGRPAALPFSIGIDLRLDPLTAVMLTVITCVGLLVAIYSIGYLHDDPGYPRFFALVAAFVFSMSMLVAASNFLLVYVFWEAVGACSYLLIGFWFRKPAAAAAAKKAFLVNRVGDFGLAVAVFLLWMTYGTLTFHDTLLADGSPMPGILGAERLADPFGIVGGTIGTAICLLLLLAACGKSAQMPLHVWLPDAMEGPTPASALIHAATMVTAGVYLVARCAPLYVACPGALTVVSIVGATTALVAALIGTVQNDLKRVLAYSTISQLGYMFASLGTGTLLGFTAAIFHLVTHAFFKALLFMGAGSVMHSMGGVIDMRRFGGLRRVMPITAATFLVGSLALAGVAPFAGFFSKDEILAALHARGWPDAHAEHHDADPHEGHASLPRRRAGDPIQRAGSPLRRGAGLQPAGIDPDPGDQVTRALRLETPGPRVAATPVGLVRGSTASVSDSAGTFRLLYGMSLFTAFLTAFYTFRAVFMTFTGPTRVPDEAGHHHHGQAGSAAHESPPVMTVPLVILAVAATVSGWWLFSTHALADFLAATPSLAAPAVAATATPHAFHLDLALQGTFAAIAGITLAAAGHLGRRSDGPQMERFLGPLETLFGQKFFLDELYAALVVKPLEFLALVAAWFDRSVIDGLVGVVAGIPLVAGAVVRRLQSGLLQRYAVAGALGTLLVVLALAWRLRS